MANPRPARKPMCMSIGAPKLPGEPHTQTTVLIVDDDLEFGQVAADLLADRGYQVVGHAATADEAVALCDGLDPDAVLLDVRLPDANGVTLANRLRGASGRPRILLTSTDRKAVGPAVVQLCGASGFVPKTELTRSDLDVFLRR
jgi:CheY-like chemotaxis protein